MVAPKNLSVIMRMHVDEARRDQLPAGVDLLAAAALERPPHRGDLAVLDRDVRLEKRAAAAIGDRAARTTTSYRTGVLRIPNQI